MKHLCLLCLFMTFALQGKSQQFISYEELPDPVKRYFPVIYKLEDTVAVQWTIEDTLYVARFVSEAFPVEVRMKANGFWVVTLWDIHPSYLPALATTYCQNLYPGYSILQSRISNNPFNEQKYFITLIADEHPDDRIILHFSKDGKPTEP